MKDIATALYLSEAFYDLAIGAIYDRRDHRDMLDASIDEYDSLNEEGYAVTLSNDDECTEVLVDL